MTPENLKLIWQKIEAARGSPGAARHIVLIGASKQQRVETLTRALQYGLRDFGENRVQEAQAKWPELKAAWPETRLHLIGPLQSNKAADAVALFDAIQTVDRVRLADALADAMERQNKRPECLIQVNTGREPQKAGVLPEEADALIAHCRDTLGLPLVGLMCVPPVNAHPGPHFALLRLLAERHGLAELSMGMSDDFETAIRLGATQVRVGRALFGERLAETPS